MSADDDGRELLAMRRGIGRACMDEAGGDADAVACDAISDVLAAEIGPAGYCRDRRHVANGDAAYVPVSYRAGPTLVGELDSLRFGLNPGIPRGIYTGRER